MAEGAGLPETGYLYPALVILVAAIAGVWLFQRLKLGAILGYLVAGVAIGPHGLALVAEERATQALAELGVVFLLFMIGLELPWQRVKVMRGRLAGLGFAQVAVTGAAIAAVALALGLDALGAFVVGAALALSSTAVVIRLLSERGQLTSAAGRAAFAVLLVQDMLIGPLLVLVVALGGDSEALGLTLLVAVAKMVLAGAALVLAGRFLLRPALHAVAALRDPDVFTALALLVVLAAAWTAGEAGLSMGFGAFLAGMALADTAFRHQVAADIQPFRALLLGLFFMSVGLTIDGAVLLARWDALLLALFALLLGKALLTFPLALAFRLPAGEAAQVALLLAEGGEFGFVLLGTAAAGGLLPAATAQLLVGTVALSLALTPLLAALGRRAARRLPGAPPAQAQPIPPEPPSPSPHVVIAGLGRVGCAAAERLIGQGLACIGVDRDPNRVMEARKAGIVALFGDATHPELLAAAHVERARAVIVAFDDPQAAMQCVGLLHYLFPALPVYVRARDEAHGRELRGAGARLVVPELVATGHELAERLLQQTGAPAAAGKPQGRSPPSGP